MIPCRSVQYSYRQYTRTAELLYGTCTYTIAVHSSGVRTNNYTGCSAVNTQYYATTVPEGQTNNIPKVPHHRWDRGRTTKYETFFLCVERNRKSRTRRSRHSRGDSGGSSCYSKHVAERDHSPHASPVTRPQPRHSRSSAYRTDVM